MITTLAFYWASPVSADKLPIEGVYQDEYVFVEPPSGKECFGFNLVSQRFVEHIDEDTFRYTFLDSTLPPTTCTRFHGGVFDCGFPSEVRREFTSVDVTLILQRPGGDKVDLILDGQSVLRNARRPAFFSCEGTDCEAFGFSEECMIHSVLNIVPVE